MLNAVSSFERTSSVITVGRDIDYLPPGYFAVPELKIKKAAKSGSK
jgi:hypothetical protein